MHQGVSGTGTPFDGDLRFWNNARFSGVKCPETLVFRQFFNSSCFWLFEELIALSKKRSAFLDFG
jgi:hypothetical protein